MGPLRLCQCRHAPDLILSSTALWLLPKDASAANQCMLCPLSHRQVSLAMGQVAVAPSVRLGEMIEVQTTTSQLQGMGNKHTISSSASQLHHGTT